MVLRKHVWILSPGPGRARFRCGRVPRERRTSGLCCLVAVGAISTRSRPTGPASPAGGAVRAVATATPRRLLLLLGRRLARLEEPRGQEAGDQQPADDRARVPAD